MKHVSDKLEKLIDQTLEWGFELTESRASKLIEFSDFLESYTEANVIGTKRSEEILEEHVLDSLSCLLFEPLRGAGRIVDVGSGGGLPGIPLGIAVVGTRVTLLEATTKKVRFLERAAEELGVSNFDVSNVRAEEAGRSPESRERYDFATARALARLDVVAEYCLPLVAVGGYALAMKGRLGEGEVESGEKAAELMGAEVSEIIPVPRLPEYEQKQRHLVVFEKTSRTPRKYPRRVGVPAKSPLGNIAGNV